jgi:Flavin containing amine oxidoreductase
MVSKLGKLLDVAYDIEYGADLVGAELAEPPLPARLYGPGSVAHVRQVEREVPRARRERPDRSGLAAGLEGQVTMGAELVAIRQTASGGYTLTFRRGAGSFTRTADTVVLALPFSILRRSVDLKQAGFSPRKLQAIREQGMGTNSKLHVQFEARHWKALGRNGKTYADTGYQNTWEVTRAQPGRSGILVDYTGGRIGASFGTGTAQTRAQQFLAQIEPMLPGISRHGTGAPPSTSGRGTSGRAARTPTGRSASTRGSPGSRGGPGGQCPLLRGAHLDRLPGLPQRRRGDRRAGRGRGDRELRVGATLVSPVNVSLCGTRARGAAATRASAADTRCARRAGRERPA